MLMERRSESKILPRQRQLRNIGLRTMEAIPASVPNILYDFESDLYVSDCTLIVLSNLVF